MKLTAKQRKELAQHQMPKLLASSWKRPENPHVAARLCKMNLLERVEFSERGLRWWEYRLTEIGRQTLAVHKL